MASSNSGFTLEENLVLSNEELTSNISKLASFIRSFEGGTWEVARAKAGKLLKNKTAFEYIDQVRATVAGTEKPKTEIKVAPSTSKKPINQQTIYEKNYDRLMAIAPGLEDKLENYKHDSIYGKSVKTGYMDFNLEVLDRDKTGFYIAISHYFESNGDLVADPDMEIFLNLQKRTIEALHFQDAYRYIEVYPDKRNRDLFSKHQKKDQNDFLADWLRNLKNQGHKIKWEEDDTTGIPPTPIVQPPISPSSVIVDNYKKEDKDGVKSVEQKSETKVEKPIDSKEEENKEEAKIISFPREDKETRYKKLKSFISIVVFREIGILVKSTDDLQGRVNHILDHQGAPDYLVNAWEELQKESHDRLKELNFHRLTLFAPDIYDLLTDSGEKLRLVSEKSKEVFSIELGDNRNKNAKTLAVYQLQGQDDIPTLLLKINEQKNKVSVDLILNQFMKMPTFSADDETNTDLEPYQASIEVENWLKFLKENKYHVIVLDLKTEKGGSQPTPTANVEITDEEPDKYDNDYINKDIPDFEPGHVQLTETHKKYGVTQKVINEINRTQKGKVIFPRKQAMIHNTKDKLADLAHQAQMPGFRISKTGKFYFEGRSNRADRTRSGY